MKTKIKLLLFSQLILLLITTIINSSCKKFLAIDPPINQITAESAYSSDATANAAIVGIYSRFGSSSIIKDITPFTSMYSDEITNFVQGPQTEFSESQLSLAVSPSLNSLWTAGYQYIYPANLAIEKLEKSEAITPALKTSLIGEAKFIRAYIYLSMTSLFGDIPLITSTQYEVNASMPRSAKSLITQKIIQDLKDAESMLTDKIDPERIRANKWCAKALLARCYLYDRQYALAEQSASEIIESSRFALVNDLTKVFLKNSSETLLQLFPTQNNQNTLDGLTFLPASANETPKYLLTNSLLNSFEPGDLRRTSWVGSRQFAGQTMFYPAKYKVINNATLSEYQTLLRLAELYLIRAEARIQQEKFALGIEDLNLLRKRSRAVATISIPNPLPDYLPTLNKADAIIAVEKERRIELMTEMGHRWFDLQRTLRADAILEALKPMTWKPYGKLWPIPDEQLKLNPQLTQNDGYIR